MCENDDPSQHHHQCLVMSMKEKNMSPHNLQLEQINITHTAIVIRFDTFKHSEGAATSYTVSQREDEQLCPLRALSKYIHIRGSLPGPLFRLSGNPVSRREFVRVLQTTLQSMGIPSDKFNSHSFRIGAATTYAQKGASDAQIRILGRWKSDAFKLYIHPHASLNI